MSRQAQQPGEEQRDLTPAGATPLAYSVTDPLAIPVWCYSTKGIAVLLVTGASYGGDWVISARPMKMDGDTGQPCGEIETGPAPRDPERALSAARAWFEAYCKDTPFHLVEIRSLNNKFGPDEAPFMTMGQAIVAIPMGGGQ